MKPAAALSRLGGIARRDQLRALAHWRRIDEALAEGSIVRTAHGWYSLPIAQEGRLEAMRLSGTASHLTAANHWGWAVKHTPEVPHVTVRSKRSLPAGSGAEPSCKLLPKASHWSSAFAQCYGATWRADVSIHRQSNAFASHSIGQA